MRPLERIEAVAIATSSVAVWAFGERLPQMMPIGKLLLWASVLLLLQALLRDAWLLIEARGAAGSRRGPRGVCLGSLVGLCGVLTGGAVLLLGLGPDLAMSPLRWSAAVLFAFGIGVAMHDFVITWRPWSLRHEPQRMNLSTVFSIL